MRFLFDLYRKLVCRPIFFRLNTVLFQLSLRGLGILNYENDKISGEWYLIHKLLPKKIGTDRPILFDVGANVGNYSASLLGSFPRGFIHAFEPHPGNYARLLEKAVAGNMKCHNMAVGESKGSLTLYDRADHNGSAHASLHEAVISELHGQKVVAHEVSVETLDEIAEREGVEFIDYLKIDTEGNEFAVLKGASRLLREERIGCIHFEFNEMNIISRVFFRDFRKILHRYDLYRLLPSGLLLLRDFPLETELFAYQNIFAVPKAKKR